MKNKTLPNVRISEDTKNNMFQALKKLNENSLIEISLQEFRRICYNFTSQKILLGEQIKITK